MAGVTLTVDPAQEWKQIFAESWRIARDFFYDPNMHGVNWQAVKAKYAAQLPAVADRSDLNGILGDMIAELNTGHAYVGGGDTGEVTARPLPWAIWARISSRLKRTAQMRMQTPMQIQTRAQTRMEAQTQTGQGMWVARGMALSEP